MSKRKLLCLLLSLILLCSLAIPGTLAVSADAANDDAAPVEVNIVYPQPSTPDAQTTEPEETCTCDATWEEKASPEFIHDVGCPFYSELYERLMAATTADAFLAVVEGMSDEALEAFERSLSEEQIQALQAHIQAIAPTEEQTPPETVVFTDAGPFMPPVNVAPVRRMMRSVAATGMTDGNGLELSKVATANSDGTYTIRMEAYTTGTVITSTKTIPVDIVLVLDQSGSMAYDFNGSSPNDNDNESRRQYAMKQAVNNFIDAVNQKYTAEADHRMAIVTFGSDASTLQSWTYVDESGKTALQGSISKLPDSPSGATNVAAGMTQAETLMGSGYSYSGVNTQRQKVVIVFTDGVPTTNTDFDTTVATSAINTAKNLKDAGATVYTVGIFSGANPNELYGASGFDTNSDGTVGSKWIKDVWGLFPGTDFPEADRPAGNRFLNFLSSNYPDAATIGLDRSTNGLGIVHYKITYEILKNYHAAANDYYLTANDSTELNNIFQTISNNIQTANINLGSETVVKDTVSEYFQLPDDASGVNLYTAAAKADGSFGDAVAAPESVTASIDNGAVSVTGFDFNANFVSDKVKEDGTYGKKLIIEFTVTPKADFIGGNDVPTNDWENSAVYGKDGTEVEKFAGATTTPTVNVPIKDPSFKVNNKTIYEGNSTNVSGLYTLPDTTGWQYDYVDVVVSGITGATVSPADCTNYNITVTYKPKTDGQNSEGTANSMSGVSKTQTATVHVLKPTVTATVCDVLKYYGESYTLVNNANGQIQVTWTDKNSHTGYPTVEGNAPYTEDDLSLAYSSDAFTGTVPKRDFDVTVKVMKGNAEIPATITTTCDISGSSCTTPATDGKYTVHVKTCQLTIVKTGGAAGEPYVFTVLKNGQKYTEVTIVGNASETIVELPVGTYTVEEDTGWSWRYTGNNGNAVVLSAQNFTGSIECTNSLSKNYWLNGFSTIVKNIFGTPKSN